MNQSYAFAATMVLAILLGVSCSSSGLGENSQQAAEPLLQPVSDSMRAEPDWPALPIDGVQPWEELDGNGHAVPAGRETSVINGNTDYTPGVERHLAAGDVQENAEALRFNGNAGNDLAYAIYRVGMQDAQPGIVSIDANLLGAGSEYYVGVSNFGGVRWQWAGPFRDSSIRLPVVTDGNGDFTSDLGNTFITVLAERGNSLDLVGVGVNQYDPADSVVPASPAGFTVTAVNGALELGWSPVPVADLAGYIVYYSDKSFINPHSAGVKRLPGLEGSTRILLEDVQKQTFVAVSSVDFGGNESPLSDLLSATPLPGQPPKLMLETDRVSERRDGVVNLSATGAQRYDWDLDGDGVFELQDDSSGSQQAITSQAGALRPRVRGRDSTGEAVALGSVTVLITGNTRPVASAVADPQSGPPPLQVTFTGVADDLEDEAEALEYAWDFNGDGFYETSTDTLAPSPVDYTIPGTWNAKFRVTDSEGAWDVDTVAITVGEGLGGFPAADLTVSPKRDGSNKPFGFDASDSSDQGGGITDYEWDIDGDGIFNEGNGESALQGQASISLSWLISGLYEVSVRVTDDDGHQAIAAATATVAGWRITGVNVPEDPVTDSVLLDVNGHPAIFYNDNDNDDLLYRRASNPFGTAWGSSEIVDTQSYIRGSHSARMVNGRPAITYSGVGLSGLLFCRATDPTGESWGGRQVLDGSSGATTTVWMDEVLARAAIAYYDTTTDSLRYIRANDADATDWPLHVTVDNSDDPGSHCSLAVVNGRPAISYLIGNGGDLAYIRADDTTGSSWGSRVILDTTNDTGYHTTLAVVDGAPAVSFRRITTSELYFVRAEDANGTIWPEEQLIESNVQSGQTPRMVLLDGLPQILFCNFGNETLRHTAAVDPAGTTWSQPQVVDQGQTGDLRDPSVITLDGRLALSYYDSDSSDFYFALLF